MKPAITKEDARAFLARWEAVNESEREELRATPIEVKFRQLAALVNGTKALGWSEAMAAEEDKVRRLWNQLRRINRA